LPSSQKGAGEEERGTALLSWSLKINKEQENEVFVDILLATQSEDKL
jgi:hypothetical protein